MKHVVLGDYDLRWTYGLKTYYGVINSDKRVFYYYLLSTDRNFTSQIKKFTHR